MVLYLVSAGIEFAFDTEIYCGDQIPIYEGNKHDYDSKIADYKDPSQSRQDKCVFSKIIAPMIFFILNISYLFIIVGMFAFSFCKRWDNAEIENDKAIRHSKQDVLIGDRKIFASKFETFRWVIFIFSCTGIFSRCFDFYTLATLSSQRDGNHAVCNDIINEIDKPSSVYKWDDRHNPHKYNYSHTDFHDHDDIADYNDYKEKYQDKDDENERTSNDIYPFPYRDKYTCQWEDVICNSTFRLQVNNLDESSFKTIWRYKKFREFSKASILGINAMTFVKGGINDYLKCSGSKEIESVHSFIKDCSNLIFNTINISSSDIIFGDELTVQTDSKCIANSSYFNNFVVTNNINELPELTVYKNISLKELSLENDIKLNCAALFLPSSLKHICFKGIYFVSIIHYLFIFFIIDATYRTLFYVTLGVVFVNWIIGIVATILYLRQQHKSEKITKLSWRSYMRLVSAFLYGPAEMIPLLSESRAYDPSYSSIYGLLKLANATLREIPLLIVSIIAFTVTEDQSVISYLTLAIKPIFALISICLVIYDIIYGDKFQKPKNERNDSMNALLLDNNSSIIDNSSL
jgi:hypothetical protein